MCTVLKPSLLGLKLAPPVQVTPHPQCYAINVHLNILVYIYFTAGTVSNKHLSTKKCANSFGQKPW